MKAIEVLILGFLGEMILGFWEEVLLARGEVLEEDFKGVFIGVFIEDLSAVEVEETGAAEAAALL